MSIQLEPRCSFIVTIRAPKHVFALHETRVVAISSTACFVLFLNWCARAMITCWAPMGELKTAFRYLLFVVAVSTWARNKDWLFTCFPLACLNTLQFERFPRCNSYNLFRQQNACNSLHVCTLIKMGVNLFLFKQSRRAKGVSRCLLGSGCSNSGNPLR